MMICLFFLKCSLEYNATEKHVSSSPAVARGLSALGSLNSNMRDFPKTLELGASFDVFYLLIYLLFIYFYWHCIYTNTQFTNHTQLFDQVRPYDQLQSSGMNLWFGNLMLASSWTLKNLQKYWNFLESGKGQSEVADNVACNEKRRVGNDYIFEYRSTPEVEISKQSKIWGIITLNEKLAFPEESLEI